MMKSPRSLAAGSVGCLASVLLAACGGGSSDPTSSAQSPSGSTVAAAVAAELPAPAAAPQPDPASVNGDKSFAVMKAARAADAAAADQASAPSATAPGETMRALASKVAAEAGTPQAALATTNTIYVSPTGNDAWSGSTAQANAAGTDGPVKTLAVAQTLARGRLAAMAAGDARAAVRVRILPGDYYLSAPLQFTPADSGTPEAMVYYEAVQPGTVLISGGMPLVRSATAAPTGQVRFDVPAAAGTGWKGGGQLYVNARRAVLARQPNAGQPWFVKSQVVLPTETSGDSGTQAFTVTSDAQAWISGLSAADRSRAIVNVMQSWTDGHHRLSNEATPAGSVRITPRAISPFLSWGLSQRTYVANVAAALDAPGEWLWESTGVRYIPAADESASSLTAVMPVLDKLVVVRGDIDNRNWVRNLWFSGISFAHTRYLLPDAGATDSQAGIDVGAAFEIDGGVGIVIDNCNFAHTAGYGVWFRKSVRDSRITNSNFDDMGGGGVKFGQANQPSWELPTGANSFVANRIDGTGKVFTGAVAVWLGQGYDNLVANNAIFNTSYTGISMGWTWGYGAVTSGRNRILNNLLHNIGQAQLSDMGGIYTVGISPGTVISGNVVREVRSYPGYGPGAWAIYNDEGASNVLVENNIVVGSDSGGYHLNYGRDNIVRNNLFALGTKFEVRVTNTDPQNTKLAFQNNLLVPLVQQPFGEYAMAPDVIFSNVQVSDKAAGTTLNLSKCGSGCALSTATVKTGADPRHVSLTNADQATIDRYAQIARDAGPWWLPSTAAVVEVPSTPPVVPVAPPTPLTVSSTGAAVGSQPAGLVYEPADGSIIGVVRDSTAPGGSCIAFNDSSSFWWSFYPYVYTSLNHDRGTSTAEFTMKIDANTLMSYEWRDGGNPYKSGPALVVTPAGVRAKGQIVAPAPVGQWLTFRVSAPVDNPNGTWSLEVTNNSTGAKTTVNNIAFASAGWSNLVWMGFMSDAATRSTTCIGGLKLTSSIQ